MKTKTSMLSVLLAVLASLTGSLCTTTGAPIPERPNIIFIPADDLGFVDINAYATRVTKHDPRLQELIRSTSLSTTKQSTAIK
jgi:hypothetical protein